MQTPGLVVPPLTPFRDDLSVDYDVLKREVDYIVEDCGAMMVSAAGVETTEYHFLSYEERKELIRRTVEFVDACANAGVGFRFHSGETGVASAAYLHVTAASPQIDDANQTLLRWYADDVIRGGPLVPRSGAVPVPTGPGLGIEVDPDAVERCQRRYLDEGPFPGADGGYGRAFRRR